MKDAPELGTVISLYMYENTEGREKILLCQVYLLKLLFLSLKLVMLPL